MSGSIFIGIALVVASAGQAPQPPAPVNPAPIVDASQWEPQSGSRHSAEYSVGDESPQVIDGEYKADATLSCYCDDYVHHCTAKDAHACGACSAPTSDIACDLDPAGCAAAACDSSCSDSCFASCGDWGCSPCGEGCFGCGWWNHYGLPCPCIAPGDLTGHTTCNQYIRGYYYFRPYNYFQIFDQQREVQNYNGDPRNPYDNRFFAQFYEDFDREEQEGLDRIAEQREATAPAPYQPRSPLTPPPNYEPIDPPQSDSTPEPSLEEDSPAIEAPATDPADEAAEPGFDPDPEMIEPAIGNFPKSSQGGWKLKLAEPANTGSTLKVIR